MPFTIGGDWIPSNTNQSKQTALKVVEQKRKGKWLTLVIGLGLNKEDLKSVTQFLKQTCHTGGTFKEDTIELQGQIKDKVIKALKNTPKGSFKV